MGFYIDMINVEQGDAFLLTLDDPKYGHYYILIDGGPVKTADKLVRHLKSITKGRISAIIATHIDSDHIGGLRSVIESMPVSSILINTPENIQDWFSVRDDLKREGEGVVSIKKLEENLSALDGLMDAIKENNVNQEPALAGRRWKHGEDIEIVILNPTPDRLKAAWADEVLKETVQGKIFETSGAPKTSPRNNASIILELNYKGSGYALFPADAGADVIKEVTDGKRYSFLKVPHHGGETGLDEELLNQLKPSTAYISVGDNSHGHPATEILDIIRKVGGKVYCSNRTQYCRRDCTYDGFGNLCTRQDKDSRPGWNPVDPKKCIINL